MSANVYDAVKNAVHTFDTGGGVQSLLSQIQQTYDNFGAASKQWYAEQMVKIYTEANPLEDAIAFATNYGNLEALHGFAETVGKGLQPVAYCIAALFFLLALVDLGMSERMNFEMFIKFFAKLGVAIALIENFALFIEFGNSLETWLTELIGFDGEAYSGMSLLDLIDKSMPESWYGRMMDVATQHIYSVFMSIGFLFMLTFILARAMELTIRGGFMPIAFCLVTEEGWRGTALRYFKKYLALLAAGPTIAVILQMGHALMTALQTINGFEPSLGGGLFISIAIIVAQVGMVKKSQDLLNDAFGV